MRQMDAEKRIQEKKQNGDREKGEGRRR